MASRGVASGYDRHVTVFSPEGRIYQIEYAFKAVKQSNLTSLAVKGKESTVLITQKKIQDKLVDPDSLTNMFRISKHIGVCTTGLNPDARAAVMRARHEAAAFEYENGYPIPVSMLVAKMGETCQLYTQQAFMRALGVMYLFAGQDDATAAPQLYKLDPAGHFMGYKAASAGAKEQEAFNQLEKQLKNVIINEMSHETTLEHAVLALQDVIGSDLKTGEVELAYVKDGRFTIMNDTEIEQLLTVISERD